MGKINLLSKKVSELIAAGEVIERPASIVKELLENSIDAGASAITLEIKKGGKTYLRITDNGCGMEPADVKCAFLRHATSKIKNVIELEDIKTLGFRGEALASICAVAKVEIISKT
ncbi:MAG: DNA mismatch repair endonuclease MutL, partial [Oscillospiraceae bacterium]